MHILCDNCCNRDTVEVVDVTDAAARVARLGSGEVVR